MKQLTKELWWFLRDDVFWNKMGKKFNDIEWMLLYNGEEFVRSGGAIWREKLHANNMEYITDVKNFIMEEVYEKCD